MHKRLEPQMWVADRVNQVKACYEWQTTNAYGSLSLSLVHVW